jgi:membrane protein implicated in regulation of membrane protease activity
LSSIPSLDDGISATSKTTIELVFFLLLSVLLLFLVCRRLRQYLDDGDATKTAMWASNEKNNALEL